MKLNRENCAGARATVLMRLGLVSYVGLAGILGSAIQGCAAKPKLYEAAAERGDRSANALPKTETTHMLAKAADAVAVPVPEIQPETQPVDQTQGITLRDFLPGVRIDVARGVVEFDGVVPIDVQNEASPRVFLELLACSRDTREHESLVVTEVKPSVIHAAMLAVGLVPGAPGAYSWQGERVAATPPNGAEVRVVVLVERNEIWIEESLADWAVNVRDKASLRSVLEAEGKGFVFSGSMTTTRGGVTRYLADGGGTIIGLTSFGTETVAPELMYNPDAGAEEPEWIADRAKVPPFNTRVKVRIEKVARAKSGEKP